MWLQDTTPHSSAQGAPTPAPPEGEGAKDHTSAAPHASLAPQFLRSVVETGGLPMALPRANATTLAAIKEAKAGKTTKVSLDDL